MLSKEEAVARLVGEIRAGRCVAFVGAGFSAPVCRGWGDLLERVAEQASNPAVSGEVRALVASRDYEVAAQILEDAFAGEPTSTLLGIVRKHTRKDGISPAEKAQMERRTKLLAGIPFSAILTTNFDDELAGSVLDRQTYSALLRDADRRWLEKHFWAKGGRTTPILKLHGELRGGGGITLSRRGYRARLYSEPGYLNVLRTVFMTKTVLYLGFSFNDAYLNELRSEALAYLGKADGATPTLAYAVLPDLHPSVQTHYAKHEGMHVFGYDSKPGHGYVDEILEAIHDLTNPAKVMGPRLHGRRILWADPSEQHNRVGHHYLREAASDLCRIDVARSPDEALARLAAETYDLVITRWGHHPGRPSDAVTLLTRMRKDDLRVPVVVFSSGAFAEQNRELGLRLGALEYTSGWERLFEVIDRRFGPPP